MMRHSYPALVLAVTAFLLVLSLPGCVVVEPTPGPQATATAGAVRKVQAEQALDAGIDIEEDLLQMFYASVAYGSGLRYDPDNEELLARLARLRLVTRTPLPTYTAVPTPRPLEPTDEIPDSEFGLRQFGQVIVGLLPVRPVIPEPQTRFQPGEQIALYVEAFSRLEQVPFEMRFFNMNTRKLLFATRPGDKNRGLSRWIERFVWYHAGGEAAGSYRVEVYSLGRLTHILPFEVGPGEPPPTATPVPTTIPPAPAPAVTPAPRWGGFISVSPPPDARDILGTLPIVVDFDTALDPASMGPDSLQVGYAALGLPGSDLFRVLPGMVSLGENFTRLTYEAMGGALPGNAVLRAGVGQRLKSQSGIPLGKPAPWAFTTAPYGVPEGGRLMNGDFSLGMNGWNADISGAASGFGWLGAIEAGGDRGLVGSIARFAGGGGEGTVGMFQNLSYSVAAGSRLELSTKLLGGSGADSAISYLVEGTRNGERFIKEGVIEEDDIQDWSERKIDLSSGSDPLRPGDVITRLGIYAAGDEYEYKVDDVALRETVPPTPTPTATPVPTPTFAPRDRVFMPTLTMQRVTNWASSAPMYMVTAHINYELVSSPAGVIRLTPYEDESNAGINWLFEITVRRGSDTIIASGNFIPKPTSSKVRFQAYFRDAAGKHIAEGYTDNYPLRGK